LASFQLVTQQSNRRPAQRRAAFSIFGGEPDECAADKLSELFSGSIATCESLVERPLPLQGGKFFFITLFRNALFSNVFFSLFFLLRKKF